MSSSRTILVTGATGKQGGAVINALLASQPTPPFKILAVTRNTTSGGAKALASKPNVSLVEGDLNDCEAIFKKADTKIWGVFSLQVPMGKGASTEIEQVQGKALVDAAVAHGVSFFVYSSVDRGGEASDSDPTNVPHFASKYNIEKHLMKQAAASPNEMQWTILRPTAFYDNFTPDMMGKMFGAMYKGMKAGKRLQLISCRDIGIFAARAFNDPDEYNGQSISLAGDDVNFDEADAVFKKVLGYGMPVTYTFLGTALRWGMKELGSMYTWFEDVGYGADIQTLRKTEPKLQDLGSWLEEDSKFTKA